MAPGESRWQVRIGPANGRGPQTLQRAQAAAPSTEGYVVDGALVVYVDSLAVARAIVAAQDSGIAQWTDISVWEPESSIWHPVDQVGDSSVALEPWQIAKTESAAGPISMRANRLISAAAVGGFGALAFLAVYVIGGAPGSSAGDRTHNLTAAVMVACFAMVAVAVKLRRRWLPAGGRKRIHREPPTPTGTL